MKIKSLIDNLIYRQNLLREHADELNTLFAYATGPAVDPPPPEIYPKYDLTERIRQVGHEIQIAVGCNEIERFIYYINTSSNRLIYIYNINKTINITL